MNKTVALTNKHRKKTKVHVKTTFAIPVVSALITFGIVFFVFFIMGINPFGIRSVAIIDAYIQYLDFFGFFKDVLNGENSIVYSYSNYLGGGTIGMFAYYLASPVNLILVFFDKADLDTFYNLAVAIKLSLCALSFAIFLRVRFENRITPVFVLLLSVSFALMNYNLVQSRNIMWLDGVYMLPFIMLGIYKLISGRSIAWFSIPLALSLIFNWYTGGINLLFCIIWFVFELFLCRRNEDNGVKYYLVNIIKYVYSLITGVFLSMMLLLPVIYNLRQGKGSEFDWESAAPFFNGNILTVISRYSIGAENDPSAFSLYCGAFVLIGVLCLFSAGFIRSRYKIIAGAAVVTAILLLYWQPLVFAFSLFKRVSSYHSRYSYVAVFIILFIAAMFFANLNDLRKQHTRVRGVGVFIVVFAVYETAFITASIFLEEKSEYLMLTSVMFGVAAALIILILKKGKNKGAYIVLQILLAGTVITDLTVNVYALYRNGNYDSAGYISEYNTMAQKQIDLIKKDGGDTVDYRINRTKVKLHDTFRDADKGDEIQFFQANYDEAFLLGYFGISGYTSCPDNNQIEFLSKLGYNQWGNCITIINDTFLPVDSMLGAKYITCDDPVSILEEMDQKEQTGFLYKNTYAFPLAFKLNSDDFSFITDDIQYSGTIDYQSKLLKSLTGVQKELYSPVEYEEHRSVSDIVYTLKNVSENDLIYGYIPPGSNTDATLIKGKGDSIKYYGWLAPYIFRLLPGNEGDGVTGVRLKAEDTVSVGKASFFRLNEPVLKEMSEAANSAAADNIRMTFDSFSCEVTAGNDESLFMSLPYSKGINVYINGKPAKPGIIGGSLMGVPLEKGKNDITVSYSLPYMKEGVILSLAGVVMIILYHVLKPKFQDRKARGNNRYNKKER